ncbi:Gfo/Idh/MocA family oxidoreductase [Candidatus Pacearchaeota archaeon]|nr:Gfo/Idh/MocA family oxidoreductase [Candidatus Pacearchaeota archaeon]
MTQVNVALIGCGYWGKNYLNLFDGDGIFGKAKLKYVHDIKQPSKKLPRDVTFTPNLEEVLLDPEINAVIIATPTKSHFDIVSKALNAGKHVLVEKPLTLNFEESKKLNNLSKEKNKILMVGHIFKYNAALREIKRRIDAGEIGQIKYLDARRVALGPVRQDASALWDLISHEIYIFMYLTEKSPISVSYSGEGYFNSVDDIVSVNIKFPGKVFATAYANWAHPVKERKLVIGGTKKAIVFDDTHPSEKLTIYDRSIEYLPNPNNFSEFQAGTREGDILIPKLNNSQPLIVQLDHFIKCLDGEEKCISDGEEGMQVVKILEAAEKSKSMGGAEVKL